MSKYGTPEIYSRFLRENNLKDSNSRVHWKAFFPDTNEINQRLEVSCYETQCIDISEVKEIASKNNVRPNKKFPHGHCSINESDFPADEIDIEKNYIPERHIDIIGWEGKPNFEDKKFVATILAEISSENIIIYDEN
ncbi:MAG: hypothetical protein HW421_564 [Ignavibacteria bacterium]|nr:hypothetical protein [Ignavibacteria bacterium]